MSSSLQRVEWMQEMDRLVSASSPSDALNSIGAIRKDLSKEMVQVLVSSEEFMTAVCGLLRESKLPNNHVMVPDGSAAICDLLQALTNCILEESSRNKASFKQVLSSPKEGWLVHSLLDVVSTDEEWRSASTRIKAMQLLSKWVEGAPTLVHAQIIAAPDGLNRIMDLLLLEGDESIVVRNEALLLCQSLAKPCCKFMIFSEGFEKAFFIALSDENSIVQQDCLTLCHLLITQDGMGPEVFLGSRSLVDGLASFLDLRRRSSRYNSPLPLTSTVEHNANNNEEDDLDDILDGTTKQTPKTTTTTTTRVIPFLTEEEAKTCDLALQIIKALTSSPRQASMMLAHATLIPLVADMALYTLPPAEEAFVSGVPPPELQLQALSTLTHFANACASDMKNKLLHDIPSLYLHHVTVLERVMYLICTGNGVSSSQLLTVSSYALSVLRATLTTQQASVMMLHTLAPLDDTDTSIPVVQRLANTCAENLYYLSHSPEPHYIPYMTVNVVGAAGALGVMLCEQESTTRDMLLQVQLPSPTSTDNNNHTTVSLLECILTYFDACACACTEPTTTTTTTTNPTVHMALLRLLVEWVNPCPLAIHALLSSPSSVTLGLLMQNKNNNNDNNNQNTNDIVRALTGLLMGLSMEFLPEEEVGGWSKASLLKLLGHLGSFTQLLERVKQMPMDHYCPSEQTIYENWYSQQFQIVRRRAIQELTTTTSQNNTNPDNNNNKTSGGNQPKSSNPNSDNIMQLNQLVAQQSLELEQLKEQLKEAQWKQQQQALEIQAYDQQIHSNPSQLDDLLQDYQQKLNSSEEKNHQLENSLQSLTEQQCKEKKELEEKLQESQTQCQQAQTEETSMKSELEGLSTAYATLESEYQILLQQTSDTDENQKLKTDLQAANDWMATALQKIDALENQVKTQPVSEKEQQLESKLKLLQTKFDQLVIERNIHQEMEEDGTRSSREKQVEELEQRLVQKEEELTELRLAMEEQAQQSQQSVEILLLKGNLKKISTAYKDAQNWMSNAVKHNETLSQQYKDLKKENEALKQQQQQQQPNNDNHVMQLQIEKEQLEEKLQTLQQQLEERETQSALSLEQSFHDYQEKETNMLQKLEEEIRKKEKAEKDLDQARKELLEKDERLHYVSSDADQISNLNRQISQLEMRWKGEEHEKLQLIELLQSKNVLVERLEVENKDLMRSLLKNENDLTAMKEDHQQLLQTNDLKNKDMDNELSSLRAQVKEREETITSFQQKESEMTSLLQAKEMKLAQISEERNQFRESLTEREQEIQEMNLKHSPERARTETELNKLKSTLESLRAAANQGQAELQEKVQQMQIELAQKEKAIADMEEWLKNAQEQHAMELSASAANDEEKDKLRQQIDQLTQSGIAAKQWMDNAVKRHESMTKQMLDYKTSNSQLNDQVLQLQSDIESNTNNYQEQIQSLKDQLETKETELSALQHQMDTVKENTQDLKHQTDETITELSSALESSKAEVEDLENKLDLANQSITNMQADLTSIKEANDALENEKKENNIGIEYLKDEIQSLQQKLKESEDKIQKLKESNIKNENFELELARNKLEHLQDDNSSLSEKIKTMEEDNSRMKAELLDLQKRTENYDDMETDLFEKENALADTEADLGAVQQELESLKLENEKTIENWKERVNELESIVSDHEEKMEQQRNEASDAIALWESRCQELEESANKHDGESSEEKSLLLAQIDTLKAQTEAYEKSIEEHADAINKLQAAISERDEAIASTGEQISSLSNELESSGEQYEEALKQWQERVQQLEQNINELENEKITIEKASKEQSEGAKSSISKLEKQCEELSDQVNKLKNQLFQKEQETSLERMTKESNEMRATICQLEDELRDANESLQSMLTDKVSNQAAEVATEMLRKELMEIRQMLCKERESLISEQELRMSAEQEIMNLKSDLAVLAKASEYDENVDGKIRELTSKAMDKVSHKERHEIQELKVALERAVQELQSSRHNEKDAQEKAASSRLHASVCEQELHVAKSDLSFLKQAVEEARESESNARSSLEYRISALEDDREMMLRSHADELEQIQAELTQLNMEKERLAHALSESEKANSALVYSTSMDRSNDVILSDSEELEKLRLEKAQLLAAVSDASLKTERRIREAIAAHASSSEAEVMLERELRESAESALEDAQFQIESLKKSLDSMKMAVADKTGKSHVDVSKITTSSKSGLVDSNKLKKELKQVQDELLKTRKEYDHLKAKHKQSENDATVVINRLKEQNRMVIAKTREIEQNVHFEAAVAAEVSRLRSESSAIKKNIDYQADNLVLLDVSPSDESKVPINGCAQEKYDFILELKAAVKEERNLYHELLTEHEELLALVAQQDLERTSLHNALVKLGGNEALQKALSDAEKKAIDQFGRYMKVR